MNAKSIKKAIEGLNLNLSDFKISKRHNGYLIDYTAWGISDNHRNKMTADQVIAKKESDVRVLARLAEVLGGKASYGFVEV